MIISSEVGQEILIPCKPTHKDVDVKLLRDGEEEEVNTAYFY